MFGIAVVRLFEILSCLVRHVVLARRLTNEISDSPIENEAIKVYDVYIMLVSPFGDE